MRFRTDITDQDTRKAFRYLKRFVDHERLQKRVSDLKSQIERNPCVGEWLETRHSLEFELAHLIETIDATVRPIGVIQSPEKYHAMSFAVAVWQCGRQLTPRGKTNLRSAVRGALRGKSSLASIKHEFDVVVDMSGKGWDIRFQDLERRDRYDFLATKDGIELEIECKTVSNDLGRKIHRRSFRNFGDIYSQQFNDFLQDSEGTAFIHVRVADRFPTKTPELKKLANKIDRALNNRRDFSDDEVTIRIEALDHSTVPIYSQEEIYKYVEERIEGEHFHMLFVGGSSHFGMLVVYSARPDRVLKSIYRQLKKAAQQLSGSRPGIVWTNIEDIEPHEWADLASESGLHLLSNKYLLGKRRQHVIGMLYNSTGEIVLSHRSARETGPSLRFFNTESPFFDERIREAI